MTLPSWYKSHRKRFNVLFGIGAVVTAVFVIYVWYIPILITPPPRHECQMHLFRLSGEIRDYVEKGLSLEESVREVEAKGYLLECAGHSIRVNPDVPLWAEEGPERIEFLLIATVVFEGKVFILDVEGEPFCYGVDSTRRVLGIPISELPDWAR